MSFELYDPKTAPLQDHVAFALSEILDDSAPLNWTRYRAAALCIAMNDVLMKDLNKYKEELSSCPNPAT